MLMSHYKRYNKIWQLQIAGKETTALQTPPNVKWSSLVYYGERGEGVVQIQGAELSAGMYIYTLIADNKVVDTKRMILTE